MKVLLGEGRYRQCLIEYEKGSYIWLYTNVKKQTIKDTSLIKKRKPATMANLVRWNPFHEIVSMRDTMDRLLENISREGILHTGEPDLDLIENDHDFVVKAELPGVAPENVDIRVEGNLLLLKGEFKEERKEDHGKYRIHERHEGTFMRTLSLPTAIRSDKAVAEYEDGILTLTLPKDDAALPKKIPVKIHSTAK